jgi:hypothetical protein
VTAEVVVDSKLADYAAVFTGIALAKEFLGGSVVNFLTSILI